MTGRSALFGVFKSTLFLAAGALGGAGVYHQVSGTSQVEPGTWSPSTSRPDDPKRVNALGSIQPKGGVVEVALPAGSIPGRLGEGVALYKPVRKGDVLAYLEGFDARQREIDVIDAEIAAAAAAIKAEKRNEEVALDDIEAERDQAKKLGVMEQDSLALKIKALEKKCELCDRQFAGVDGLQHNNTISRQQHDELDTQVKISRDELKYARAEATRVDKSLELNTNDATIQRRKDRARALAERARSQISPETLNKKKDLAVAMREQSKVLAPIDGVVLDICTKPGESGAGRPLVKLGDTSTMYVQAEIFEDERRLVREGQIVEVRGRGLPEGDGKPILGKVERINPMVGLHKQLPLDPTSRDNAHVFPAWIALEPADSEKLRDFSLVPVEVSIRVEAGPSGGR